MKKLLQSIAIGAAVVVAAGSTVISASRSNDPPAKMERDIGGAKSRYARMSALVGQGGTVIRSRGVESVTHPSTGLYCIQRKWPKGVDVTKVIPAVTVDWSNSLGDDLLAYWRSSGVGCPADNIAVVTFARVSGTLQASDNVAFALIVP